ncbi:MAG TPA: GAF and ANTAR domain-containing protein [Streptomyces sp.]|nr:GAF and ANTAR domain-containing protein [Streptomyces sp.]
MKPLKSIDTATDPYGLHPLTSLDEADEHGGQNSLNRGLNDLAERAVLCTPGGCGAAVTLTDGTGDTPAGLPEGPASVVTHPDLSALVAVQWASGEGPVPEVLETGEPVVVRDLLGATQWPRFRAMALQRGLRGCATFPFRHDGAVLTVSVYSFRPHRLSEIVQDTGAQLAELAAGVLGVDRRHRGALAEVAQLHSALRSRPVVDQACGIVMGLEGCTAKEAFDLLRVMSQRSGRQLAELAEALVRNRGRGVEQQLRELRRSHRSTTGDR